MNDVAQILDALDNLQRDLNGMLYKTTKTDLQASIIIAMNKTHGIRKKINNLINNQYVSE